MKAWELTATPGIDGLALRERDELPVGPGQVRIAVRAISLNYRDLATVQRGGGNAVPPGRIPCSDGAGEVVEVGANVSRFAVGDRVVGCFFQRWMDGDIASGAMGQALGGGMDGTLAERVVLSEEGVVAIPGYMSFDEAATLPCAALTAWQALVPVGHIKAGDTVLLLGTGGVSIFGLQFVAMHGARAIVTSSSDEKLARARDLGASETINYRTEDDWAAAVLARTDGQGADHVLEVGGAGTLAGSLRAVRVGGIVTMIGALAGASGSVDPRTILMRSVRLQGIFVGSRRMFEDMNAALALHETKPVIDRRFAFDDTPGAFRYMESQAHLGKIVITTSPG